MINFDKELLIDFITWVDNNTYLLDGERYWEQFSTHGEFTELATNDKLAEVFIDNINKNMEHKTFNEYPYGND